MDEVRTQNEQYLSESIYLFDIYNLFMKTW